MKTLLSIDLSTLSEMLQIFSEAVNLGSVLMVAIISGIVAFLFGALLMLLFRKTIFVKRKYKLLTILPYTYVLFIPLLVGFTAFQWFALHKIEKQLVKNIPTLLQDERLDLKSKMKDLALKSFSEEELNKTFGEVLDHYEKEVKTELIEQKEKLTWVEGKRVDKIVDKLLLSQPKLFRKQSIKMINKRIGKKKMDQEMATTLMNEKFINLLDGEIIAQFIETQLVKGMGTLKQKVLLIFFLIMLIPIVEISWSVRQFKKNTLPKSPNQEGLQGADQPS